MRLEELNASTPELARDALRSCCGSSRWVDAMVARRPFRDAAELQAGATAEWEQLRREDWLEAFSHHPRIGDLGGTGWSRQEQKGVQGASEKTLRALFEGNGEYERKFGFVFLACATGRSADELLALLRERLTNDPQAELRVAVAELARITRLRLEKLLNP